MLNADGTKTCARCSTPKPTTEFYRVNRRTGDGYHGYCIACVKAKVIAWQKANPEKKAAQDKKQNAKPERRAKIRLLVKAWTARHPEYSRAAQARWRALHPDKVLEKREKQKLKQPEYARRHRAKPESKEKHRLREHLHRQTRYGLGSSTAMTLAQWRIIQEVFGHRCAYCDKPEGPETTIRDGRWKLTIDHVQPLSKGGAHTVANIVPVCLRCNSKKKERTLAAFMPNFNTPLLEQKIALAMARCS
jgi:hypothetical protein